MPHVIVPHELIDKRTQDAGWILSIVKYSISLYAICMITRCAETGLVPPARGVMVSAVELPAGFRTVSNELMTVVVTRASPTI